MTAACSGGTSAPKLGSAIAIGVGSGYIAEAIEVVGSGWLRGAIPWLVIPEIVLNSFCGSDPPSFPSFTAAEANALLNLTLGADFSSGLPKFLQLVQRLVWYDNCTCTSGTLVPIGSGSPPPSGAVVDNRPVPQPAAACTSSETFFSTDSSGGTGDIFTPWGGPIVAGMTSVTINLTTAVSVAGTLSGDLGMGYNLNGSTGAHTPVTDPLHWTNINGHFTGTWSLPPGVTTLYLWQSNQTGTGTTTLDAKMLVYCNGQTGAVQTPCCPPDAATQTMLENIYSLVVLLQRNMLPFATVPGATHSGLSGAGSFSIPRCIGIRVGVDAVPPYAGVVINTPNYYPDLGWLSITTPDGFIDEVRVAQTSFAWRSRLFSDANLIGYYLNPGVTIHVQELYAEQ